MSGHSSANFRDQAFVSLTQEYNITERIGSGTYGQVFRAHRWDQTKNVAIKVYRPGRHGSVSEATADEVGVLKQLKKSLQFNPQYRDIFAQILQVPLRWQTATHAVFDFYPMDMWHILDVLSIQRRTIPLHLIQAWLVDLLRGLEFLHGVLKWIHCDIKPANLLVSDSLQLRIADMGGVCFMEKPCNYREGDEEIYTITYRAPELLDPKCYTYTSSVDMWAVGCVLLDLLFCPSVTPIHDRSTSDAVLAVYTTMLQYNREYEYADANRHHYFYLDDLDAICNHADLLSNVVHQRCYTTCSAAYKQDAKTFLILLRHCLFYDPGRRMAASTALSHLAVLSKPMKQTPECQNLRALLRDDYGLKEAVSKPELYRELAEAMGTQMTPEL